MTPDERSSKFGPGDWLRDRIPTLTEEWHDPSLPAAPPDVPATAELDARIEAAVRSAVDAALVQWKAQIEPQWRQIVAVTVADAVSKVLRSPDVPPRQDR